MKKYLEGEHMENNKKLMEYLEKENVYLRKSVVDLGSCLDGWLKHAYNCDDKGHFILSRLYPYYASYFTQLENLTRENENLIPALKAEKEIMGRIRELLIEVKKIIEKVPDEREKRNGRTVLWDEEYAAVTDNFNRCTIFWEYRMGRNVLQRATVRDKVDDVIYKGLDEYRKFIDATERNTEYYIPDIDRYGIVNYMIADAHTGSVIPEVLRTKNVEIFFEEIPKKGIEELIQDREDILKQILDKLNSKSIQYECGRSLLKMRSNPKKMRKYLELVEHLLNSQQNIEYIG